uniref:DNA replication factor Cdt1 n=1 Tax=Petromyzon marinus TaxID=7757 RepID=A0AAJ7UEM2_PETMA|nr:DNA replication factor Cdt1 [Petromyzon marinus]
MSRQQQTSLTDFFGSRRRSSAAAAAAAAMPAKRLKLRGSEGGFHFSGGDGGGCGGDAVEAKALSDVVVFSGAAAMASSSSTTTTTMAMEAVAVRRGRRGRRSRETKATKGEEGRTRVRGDVATSGDDDHHRGERRRRRRPRRIDEEVVEEVEEVAAATIATPSSAPRQLRAARRREGDEERRGDGGGGGDDERRGGDDDERRGDGGDGDDERRVMVENDVATTTITAITTTTRRRRRLGEQQRKRGEEEEEEEGRRGDGCGENDEEEEEVGHHGESPEKRSRETPRGAFGQGRGREDEGEAVGRRAARKRLHLEDEPVEKEGAGDGDASDGDAGDGGAGDGDAGDAGTGDGDAGYPPAPTAGLRKSVKEQLNRRLSLSPACGGPKASPRGAPPTPQKGGGCPGDLQVAQKANAAEAKQSLGTCSSLAELQAKIRRIQQKKKQQEEEAERRQQQPELERKAQGNAGTLASQRGRDLDSAELKAAVERARSARALASRLLDRRSLAPPSAAPATPPPCVRPLQTTTPTAPGPALRLARTTPGSGENVPAFERFHTLARDVPPGLTLPLKMTLLAEMFRSMDTVVGMLFNRAETVTFAKVQSAVHEMLRRRFEERSVGQIHAVYPEAYRFRQERAVVAWSHSARPGDYHLTIEPLLPTGDTTQGSRPHLTAARLLERRRSFHRRLLAIVKKHHKAFLESLSPPMAVPEDRLARWHPRFDVDAVPDVTPAPLPRPPDAERCTTAGDALRMARGGGGGGGGGGLTPKMEKALANVALKSSGATPGDRTTAQTENRAEAEATPGPAATLSPALKGISQSLIDRVRAREAARAAASMQRDAGAQERAGRLRSLPAVARTLRGVFLAERRPALPMELACSRLVQSCGLGTTAGEMEQLLRLLADAAPRWLGLVATARGDLYVKLLDKSADLSQITTQLQERARQEQATL